MCFKDEFKPPPLCRAPFEHSAHAGIDRKVWRGSHARTPSRPPGGAWSRSGSSGRASPRIAGAAPGPGRTGKPGGPWAPGACSPWATRIRQPGGRAGRGLAVEDRGHVHALRARRRADLHRVAVSAFGRCRSRRTPAPRHGPGREDRAGIHRPAPDRRGVHLVVVRFLGAASPRIASATPGPGRTGTCCKIGVCLMCNQLERYEKANNKGVSLLIGYNFGYKCARFCRARASKSARLGSEYSGGSSGAFTASSPTRPLPSLNATMSARALRVNGGAVSAFGRRRSRRHASAGPRARP